MDSGVSVCRKFANLDPGSLHFFLRSLIRLLISFGLINSNLLTDSELGDVVYVAGFKGFSCYVIVE